MRITNTLFIVAAATTVGFQGCGNEQAANDLRAQLEQIKKTFPDLHDHEKVVLDRMAADVGNMRSGTRRKYSKFIAETYTKGKTVPRPSDNAEIDAYINSLRKRVGSEDDASKLRVFERAVASMNPAQRARMAAFIGLTKSA